MALADLGLLLGLRATELVGRAAEAVGAAGFPRFLGFPGFLGLSGFPGDLPEPQNDPERVREMADDILSRPEYREPSKSVLERVRDWIAERLADLLEGIGFGSSGAGSVVGWITVLVLGALVAGLAYWLVRSLVGDGWGRKGDDEGDPVILSVDEHRTPDEWLAAAERHEAEGRWREGMLCRYRSLVTRLVELEVIPEARGRTAGEYVGDVAARLPAASGPFRAATDLFESAWYGGVDTGPDGRDRFVGLAGTVLASAADRRARADRLKAEAEAEAEADAEVRDSDSDEDAPVAEDARA